MKIPLPTKNSLFSYIATLVTGTAMAQVLMIAFQLVLRRVFDPEVFGVFAVFISAVSIWVVPSTLRYEQAVVLPPNKKTADSLVSAGSLLVLAVNAIAFVALLFFRAQLAALLNVPLSYSWWLLMLPLSAALVGIYQFQNYYLIRIKAYKNSAHNKIIRRGAEGSVQATSGLFQYTSGLVLGDITGNLINVIVAWFQITKRGFRLVSSPRMMAYALKRYANFPKIQAAPAVLNVISLSLPVFLINKFFEPEIAGYFDLSRQVLVIPLALITMSTSQVLLQNLSERRNKGKKMLPVIRKTALVLSALMVPFIALIVVFGPDLFVFVFSDTWLSSGQYARILVFAFAVQFVVSPLSAALTALEKLKLIAFWQLAYFILIWLLLAFRDMEISDFLLAFTLINLLSYLIYFLLIYFAVRASDKSVVLN